MMKQNSSSRLTAKENKVPFKQRSMKTKIVEPNQVKQTTNDVSPGPIDLRIAQGPFSPLANIFTGPF